MGRLRSRDDLDAAMAKIASRFSGQLGLAATNLTTGETVEVNADSLFPTASVIKLAVLVEVFRQAEEGRFGLQQRLEMRDTDIVRGSGILKELNPGLSPTIHDLAMLMVVLSDNTATNMLIDLVGGVAAVNQTMHERLGLPAIVLHNRIDFARIGGEVRRLAESTPRAMARLVELLARGEVVSPEASAAMVDIMRRQQYLDQVPRYLNFNPYAKELGLEQTVWVGCKTGFFPGCRVDAGIVQLPAGVTVAYCAMTENSDDRAMAIESEPAVVNGLLGRVLLEYWWPGAAMPDDAMLTSPYVDALLD